MSKNYFYGVALVQIDLTLLNPNKKNLFVLNNKKPTCFERTQKYPFALK